MINISVLASGSKGNVSYIALGKTKILVDIGITSSSLEKKLLDIEVNPKEIDAILLTHIHTDHINGLKVFIKKYNTKVYLSEKMYFELSKIVYLEKYEIIDKKFILENINIEIIKMSHDIDDCNGYIMEYNDKSIAYITDTGYINRKYFEKLKNKDIYVIESNHDVDMLMTGNRPYYIRQRILGDNGHLSNEKAALYLTKFIGEQTKKIILIHLSDDNNTKELALESLNKIFQETNINFDNIIISSQSERTDLIEI